MLPVLLEPGTLLSVDGGIDSSTIGAAAGAGANCFAVGSAIFRADDYAEAVEELAGIAGSHLAPSSLEN